jgi:hypothetical protein
MLPENGDAWSSHRAIRCHQPHTDGGAGQSLRRGGQGRSQQLLDFNIQWHIASPAAITKVLSET